MKKINLLIILLVLVNYCNAANYYWVGGTGNWSDFGNHWATTSGGAIFYTLLPDPTDDVFFDANSFTSPGDTVYGDLSSCYCHNMDWTNAQYNPVLAKAPSFNPSIKIYGSLTLVAGMKFKPYNIYFEGSNGNFTITTSGVNIPAVYFEGSNNYYTLNDDLNVTNVISLNYMNNGTLNTNSKNITCNDFNCYASPTHATLLMMNSIINCTNGWDATDTTHLTLNTANSKIYCSNLGTFRAGTHQTYNDVETRDIRGNYNSFHDVTFPGYGQLEIASYNTFHNVYVAGNFLMFGGSNNNTFNKAVFLGDVSIDDPGNTFDSLNCNCPGHTIGIGGAIYINDTMWINSLPGQPVTIQGSGTTDTLVMTSGTFCADYLYLQNMVATGGASFFAGLNSVDLGNNSGWSFTSCAPVLSNVWPGDANYDLIVDNLDLLNIGLTYNDTGYVRPGASLNYIAQPCYHWYYQFASGVNVKHADCDGNGIVNAADTTAVSLNYGQTHPPRLGQTYSTAGSGPDLSFQMPGVLPPGTIASIPILLSGSIIPCYGFAFTINFDPSFIVPGSMSVSYAGTVLATAGNYIHLEKDFYASGNFDLAFSRINHTDTAKTGLVATLTFTVANNASGTINLSFSNITFIQHQGFELLVNPHNSSAITGIENLTGYLPVSFYPNPMTDQATLYFTNADHQNYFLSVYDMTGQKILPLRSTSSGSFIIERKNMPGGIYFYQLTNADNRKIARGKFLVE